MALLHQKLRDLVDTCGMSKSAFASAAGLSRTSLFHILRGTSLPKRGTLDRFLQILKLEEGDAGELVHLLETARLNSIDTTRKEVRSAQELFRSSVFADLQKVGECTLVESRIPDFWLNLKGQNIPVFAERKIIDPFNLLGRAQALRSRSGELKSSRWQVWVCVTEMEPAYENYLEDFEPFHLRVGTLDALLKSISEPTATKRESKKASTPKPESAQSETEHHFEFSIECD